MTLKLFEMLKKPVHAIAAPLKKIKPKTISKGIENQYMILNAKSIPTEYFCELHPTIRKQLSSKLVSQIPSVDYPFIRSAGNHISTVI